MYILAVGQDASLHQWLAHNLRLEKVPAFVRLVTNAPLSNDGYPPEARGMLLGTTDHGCCLGVEGAPEIPRILVPWSTIAYLADGDLMASETAAH